MSGKKLKSWQKLKNKNHVETTEEIESPNTSDFSSDEEEDDVVEAAGTGMIEAIVASGVPVPVIMPEVKDSIVEEKKDKESEEKPRK